MRQSPRGEAPGVPHGGSPRRNTTRGTARGIPHGGFPKGEPPRGGFPKGDAPKGDPQGSGQRTSPRATQPSPKAQSDSRANAVARGHQNGKVFFHRRSRPPRQLAIEKIHSRSGLTKPIDISPREMLFTHRDTDTHTETTNCSGLGGELIWSGLEVRNRQAANGPSCPQIPQGVLRGT